MTAEQKSRAAAFSAYVEGLHEYPDEGVVLKDVHVEGGPGAEIKGPLLIEGIGGRIRKPRPPSKSIIEGVAEWLSACPLLKDGAFRVDALGDQPTEYAIEVGAFDPIIETYIDGSSDRRYQVNFGSREAYDLDRVQNIANSAFYEEFSEWIADMGSEGDFPTLPEGCTPETIKALSSGFLFSEDGKSARYQIQIELTYHKDA